MTINVAEWFEMTSTEKDIAINCIAHGLQVPTRKEICKNILYGRI